MINGNEIAGVLTVDYFKPSGKWYDTITTEVTFAELSEKWFLADNYFILFFKKTGRALPHPYFTSFIRLENQHPESNHFCRYLIQPLETNAT